MNGEDALVTVLFVDVVRSMEIAASEGPERLREIMADLFDRSAIVVQRYGGTEPRTPSEDHQAPGVEHMIRVVVADEDLRKLI